MHSLLGGLFRTFSSPYQDVYGTQLSSAQIDQSPSSSSYERLSAPSSPSMPSQPSKRISQEARLMILIPKQKRRKLNHEDQIWTPANYRSDKIEVSSDDESKSVAECFDTPRGPRKGNRLDHIRPSDLVHPKSQYVGWTPPLPVSPEREAIKDLKAEWNDHSTEYVMFRLSDFSIYRPIRSSTYTGGEERTPDYEMEPLHLLANKHGVSELLFDGILTAGNERRYVQRVPFKILTIEGYGDSTIHSVTDKICIQSVMGKDSNVWYELGEPSTEYRRFHEPFLWITDFTKFFIDYMLDHDNVEIRNFRARFYRWIYHKHKYSRSFQRWFSAYGRTDFKTVVAAHVGFLWKEATNVEPELRLQPIWKQVDPEQLEAIKAQAQVEQKTIVSPYVYELFKNMYFADCLQPLSSNNRDVVAAQSLRRSRFKLTNDIRLPEALTATAMKQNVTDHTTGPSKYSNNTHQWRKVRVGDIVSVSRDQESAWKDNATTWYAYVQGIRKNRKGERLLDVIWLYRPDDTTLSNGAYPIANELFFSDNCNCGDGVLKVDEVLSRVSVELFARDVDSASDHIVRQKYCTDDHSFVTLKKSDLVCQHKRTKWKSDLEEVMEKYRVGDTVFVAQKKGSIKSKHAVLEPVVIRDFILDQEKVVVQRLLRCNRDFGQFSARPNELVWTDEILHVSAKLVRRRCHVRFFSADDVRRRRVPAPYNRDGTADCFYITTRLVNRNGRQQLENLSVSFPSTMCQGFNPTDSPPRPPLKGLSLFCGGGNFDRGLEEGGAVKFDHTVDYAKHAMHSYRANLRDPNKVELYLGSIDDYLADGIRGKPLSLIARVGDVEVILAGSPCQGFSNMQRDKNSSASLRNASKVASVATAIEHYLPQYALLENVVTMASRTGPGKNENVFSQLLCAIVGMGYQVQQFNLDAWSFGDSQSRSRLFIAVTAPGLTPLPHPALTHSHPSDVTDRCLGRAVNGQRFGERRFEDTPFGFVTAREATADLPWIGDARVQTCIAFPDHRTSVNLSAQRRGLVAMIPTVPRAMNLVKAIQQDKKDQTHWIAKPHLDHFYNQGKFRAGDGSRQWGRVHPDKLFRTILTTTNPTDAIQGTTLHWDEHRPLTVMEARRAQGFRDDDVLVGLPSHQWKIVGNSVARSVAVALGMSLREAWLANSPESQQKTAATEVQVADHASRQYSEDPIALTPADYQGTIFTSLLHDRSEEGHGETSTQAATSEEIEIVTSVSIKRNSMVHRTSTVEQRDDTLEILSRTTYQKSTRVSLPLREQPRTKNPTEAALDEPKPKKPRNSSVSVVIPRRHTRSEGEAEFSPASWSKIPGRERPQGR